MDNQPNPRKPDSLKPQKAEPRQDLLWGQLQALVAVACWAGFTRAARRPGLSKAAISQRIAELGAMSARRWSRAPPPLRAPDRGRPAIGRTRRGAALRSSRSLVEARNAASHRAGCAARHPRRWHLGRQHVAPALPASFFGRCRRSPGAGPVRSPGAAAGPGRLLTWRSAAPASPPDACRRFRLCASRACWSPARVPGTPWYAGPAPVELSERLPAYLRPDPATGSSSARAARRTSARAPAHRRAGPLRAGNSEILRGRHWPAWAWRCRTSVPAAHWPVVNCRNCYQPGARSASSATRSTPSTPGPTTHAATGQTAGRAPEATVRRRLSAVLAVTGANSRR